MASTCPNCGKKLKWYNVKAECSECGVSIPNFNWEGRLEEDAERSERKFRSYYRNMNMLAYSILGTKLRKLRIILSFLPAIGFFLPWGQIKSDTQSIGLDLFGLFTDGKSLLDVISDFFANKALYFTNMAYEGNSGVLTFSMLSILFMLLSILLIVIAFFLILFTFKKPKTKAIVVFDALSVACAVASGALLSIGIGKASTQTAVSFGSISLYNISGGISWGIFVAIALLAVALIINILQRATKSLKRNALQRRRQRKKKSAKRILKKRRLARKPKRLLPKNTKELLPKQRQSLKQRKTKRKRIKAYVEKG